MNKSFLFVIMMISTSFTGCIDSEDSEEILTDPVGEVNVPGNALVLTRDADSTECSNGGITLDVGVDEDGDGKLNSTETFNTSTICNGADGQDVTRSNTTVLTRIDDPADSLNCQGGGRVISHGLDNGDGNGVESNGLLEEGEIDSSTTLCTSLSIGLMLDINLGTASSYPSGFTALRSSTISLVKNLDDT